MISSVLALFLASFAVCGGGDDVGRCGLAMCEPDSGVGDAGGTSTPGAVPDGSPDVDADVRNLRKSASS